MQGNEDGNNLLRPWWSVGAQRRYRRRRRRTAWKTYRDRGSRARGARCVCRGCCSDSGCARACCGSDAGWCVRGRRLCLRRMPISGASLRSIRPEPAATAATRATERCFAASWPPWRPASTPTLPAEWNLSNKTQTNTLSRSHVAYLHRCVEYILK